MDFIGLSALVISGLVFLYTIFKDSTNDTSELVERISNLETKTAVHDSDIGKIEAEQDKLKETIRSLESQIHEIDKKIERILTILEREGNDKRRTSRTP